MYTQSRLPLEMRLAVTAPASMRLSSGEQKLTLRETFGALDAKEQKQVSRTRAYEKK